MRTKLLYMLLLIVLLAAVSVFSLRHHPVCPDDFATSDEATAAVNAWTNSFYDSHPGASLAQWGEARHQFWVDNHCTAALQRYDEAKAGKADPATMERVNKVIQDATQQ